jgi:hypothetical protein
MAAPLPDRAVIIAAGRSPRSMMPAERLSRTSQLGCSPACSRSSQQPDSLRRPDRLVEVDQPVRGTYGPCEHCLNQPHGGTAFVDWRRSCPRRWTITDVRGEGMGDIVFRGREPFDLIAQRLPSAIAENKIVVATLPIFASGFPGNSTEIRLLLAPHQAEDLARQLLLEAKKARENPL